MKRTIFLVLILFSSSSFSQEIEKSNSFNKFELSFLGGINVSKPTGSVFLAEGKTNIASNVNAKFSIGYSSIYKNEGHDIKTYHYTSFSNGTSTISQYDTYSYTLDRIRYSIIPISLGIEYFFHRSDFSPYGLVEAGYNFYEHKEEISNKRVGFDGSFSTFEGLPSEYKNNLTISENTSYRIALGAGISFNLTHSIGLDLRYIYQINSSLVNSSQILFGLIL